MKAQGKSALPKRWEGESLWAITGHDGTFPFHCKVVVAGGVVRSAPPLAAWMLGRTWLECAQMCLERDWIVTHVDTEAAKLREQEKARHARGSVQLGLDLDDGAPTGAPEPE